MMASGLTSLGIVNLDMVTTEELMKENSNNSARTDGADKCGYLKNNGQCFDNSLDILMTEEVLSGEQFRCQFRDSALLPA